MNKKRIKANVKGIVQGVCYRHFTNRTANSYGLGGYVRNCCDGSVEVVAEGEDRELKNLIADLNRGPWSARVDDVEVEWEEYTGNYNHFTVRF
ncbi:MAG: acylphosphatase [Candidatus Eremiobacteraeota bacterium]|nr:acylphosphatase [Candidatus Eremiobacteraeota bacterium]